MPKTRVYLSHQLDLHSYFTLSSFILSADDDLPHKHGNNTAVSYIAEATMTSPGAGLSVGRQ